MIETVNSQQNQRFEYDEKRQQVNDLEMMIADFRRMAGDLDQQIKIEQQASGISDVNHFAYPTSPAPRSRAGTTSDRRSPSWKSGSTGRGRRRSTPSNN